MKKDLRPQLLIGNYSLMMCGKMKPNDSMHAKSERVYDAIDSGVLAMDAYEFG